MQKKRILCLAVSAGLFLFSVCAFADEKSAAFLSAEDSSRKTEEKEICTLTLYCEFTFQRASGGWTVCSAGDAFISDDDVQNTSGAVCCSGSVKCICPLRSNVISAIKNGSKIKVALEDPGLSSCVDFSYFEYSIPGISTLNYELKLSPVLSGYLLNSFVSGLNVPIPLIDNYYGRNVYTLFPLIGSAKMGQGCFYSSSPGADNSPYISPAIIKNSRGAFKTGVSVFADGEERSGIFYSIGKNGSFADGSAVRLVFSCPIRLRFSAETDVLIKEGSGEYTNARSENTEVSGESVKHAPNGAEYEEEADTESLFLLRLHRKR